MTADEMSAFSKSASRSTMTADRPKPLDPEPRPVPIGPLLPALMTDRSLKGGRDA
jgi:hypothetical protein